MSDFADWCKQNTFPCAVIVVLVVLLILYFAKGLFAERMGNPFYLNQIAMDNWDPSLYMYTSRQRNVQGMDLQDYYLENQMNASTEVNGQLMLGNAKYEPADDFLGMPMQYRPKIVDTGIVANSRGQTSYWDQIPDSRPPTMAGAETTMKNTSGTKAEVGVVSAVAKEGYY
jgi:hypothetical protein